MGLSLFTAALLVAQEVEEKRPEGIFSLNILMFLGIGFLFYFMLVRPGNREKAIRAAMIRALKENDRVVTVGGIYGIVTNVHREADEVTIRVDDKNNTRIRVTLGAISRVLGDEAKKGESPTN